MKPAIALSISFLLLGIIVLPACNKTDAPQTRLTRLQRTWQLVQTGTDANANGQIEDYELQPISESMNNIIVFNTDKTGKETITVNGVTTDYPFSWSMDANMDTVTRVGVGHNTIKYYMADISSISMELTTTSNLGLVAYVYKIK